MIAHKLSRLGQIIQTEWSLPPEVFKQYAPGGTSLKWTCLPPGSTTNYISVSPVPDPQAWIVDALSLPWEDLDPYAFPPVAILGKVVEKLQDHPCNRLILLAPGWYNMPWFWDLVTMSSQIPLCLYFLPDL